MFVSFEKNLIIGENSIIGNPPNDASTIGRENIVRYYQSQISPYFPVSIGKGVIIRDNVCIDFGINRKTTVNDNVYIHSQSSIHHDALIDRDSVIGPNACICGNCTLLESVQVGAMCSIHQNLTVGGYSMLGMNAAIVNNIPPFVIAYGVPAKIKKLNTRKLGIFFSNNDIQKIFKEYIFICQSGNIKDLEMFCSRSIPNFVKNQINQYILKVKKNC